MVALDRVDLLSDLFNLGGSHLNREVDCHEMTLTRRKAGNAAVLAPQRGEYWDNWCRALYP